MKNYYKILGLKVGATLDEVERKYNDLLKEFDPTKQPDELKEFFTSERQKVQEAYNKISLSFNNNNNKTIVGSLIAVFFLVFSITYLIFQNKVEKVRASIPTIEKKELDRSEQNKTYWTNKYNADYPNKDFTYLNLDSRTTRDTLVSFFIYKKYLPINTFKDCFFECMYFDRINKEKYLNFFVTDLPNSYRQFLHTPSELLYLKLKEDITKKYKITKDEFEKLVYLAINTQYSLGNEVFIKEDKTSKDIECLLCYNDYRTNYIINDLAVDEFKDFVKKYMKDKKAVDDANRVVEREYKSEFNNLTSGMSYSLKNKVSSEVETKFLSTTKKVYYNYYGSDNGIGDILYSFDKIEYATLSLDDIVNDVYKEYYSDNSLYTGATPYSYCYGGTPYCSPPSGYAECSFIDVRAPSKLDVIVIIKKNNRVYSHAYIKAGGYYKFKLGNGSFQSFFYYGKGWNPNKYIKNANCGKIIGGFVNNEYLDKSEIEYLYNSSMSYTLYSVENGNFRPKSSNKNEAF